MMNRTLFAFAFHVYALGAAAYLAYLVRQWKALAVTARMATGAGLVLQGAGLFVMMRAQGGMLEGLSQGLSAVVFLLVAIYLALDLRSGLPVIGAFLMPAALALWAPALWLRGQGAPLPAGVRQPLLPVHISIALLGIAAFAVAAGVGGIYLLMEREVKGKRFGLLFSRLPSLESLDDLNRRLVLGGFIALSLTLVTGAFFASAGGPFWAWHSKEVATLIAWALFAAVVNARTFAGWRGKRIAWLTMAGFGVVLICLFASYGAAAGPRGGP